ncbi:MAG: VWA domain-containing protein [Gemmataceae bacterium]
MAIRHRTPTIFSIYMVDVLCCALGCVILLWQLYHSESEEQTAAARDALDRLASAKLDLAHVSSERDDFKGRLEDKTLALEKTEKEKVQVTIERDVFKTKVDKQAVLALVLQRELDTLRATHRAAEAALASLKADYGELLKKSIATSTDLAAKIRAHLDLLDKTAGLEKRLTALEKELDLKTVELKFATEKRDLSAKKIDDAEARAKKLEKLLADLKAEGKESLTKLSVSDLRVKLLEQQLELSKKELAYSGKRITDLLSIRDSLTERVLASTKDIASLREKVDRRFEGISLEGKKVVFLIDISGSMVMKDPKTNDAEKWPKVVAAIERVASSLVDAESYQVILFSSDVRYLFAGTKREWLTFDKATSPKKLGAALRAVKPEGGTNLYAGLEEVFEFRKGGLETVYVFSDGLPTEGPGLSEEDAKLSDSLQSEKLGRHIRSRLAGLWNPPTLRRRVSINAIGFFFDTPEVGAFLWALARENEGSFVGMSKP